MDVLIHYRPADAVRVLHTLAERTSRQMIFTLAPGSRLLRAMLAAGKVFPRGNRAPAIYPVDPSRLVAKCCIIPSFPTGRPAAATRSPSVSTHRRPWR